MFRRSSGTRPRRIGRILLVAAVVGFMAVPIQAPLAAQAVRVAGVTATSGGYTQTFTQPGAPNVVATYTLSGGTVKSSPDTAAFPTKNSNAGMYSQTIPAGTATAQIQTEPASCGTAVGNFECANRGTVKIAFSSPVDNPVVHIAGLGAFQGENRYGAAGVLSSVPAGATMSVAGNATNLQVVNGGRKFQTTSSRPNTVCDATPAGANGTAGCGSLQVAGSDLTEITFNLSLKGNRGVNAAIETADQWTILVTLPDAPTPALDIVKTSNVQQISAAGQVVTYSFAVTNTGNVPLDEVTPQETSFTGTGQMSPFSPGPVNLDPGETQTFTSRYIVTQDDINAGTLNNVAIATGTGPKNTPVESPPSEVTIAAPAAPDLTIVKSATPSDSDSFTVGQQIEYSFLVTNTGNTTLTEVTPSEEAFTGTGELGAFSPGPVTLEPGAQQLFTADYTLTQQDVDSGRVDNTATATGNPPNGPPTEAPPSEYEIPVSPNPSISLVKSANTAQVSLGDTITYKFLVENTGNVTLTDVAPSETEFSGSGTLSGFTPETVDRLIPGERATFTAEYTVTQDDVDRGAITNAAIATGTPPTGPPVNSPPFEVEIPALQDPELTIVKSADITDTASFTAGQKVTYSFLVTNTGNLTLTDVTPVEGDFTGSGELGPITPGPVTLTPGQKATFTAEYTLTQADVDSGSVYNSATATGVPPSGPPVDTPPSEVTIPTPAESGLSIVKSADKSEITTAGEIVTYSFLVANVGNVTLTDVAPVEVEFSGTGELSAFEPETATLAPGEDTTFTATYTVTQADIDAGGITNAASATGTPPEGSELPPTPPSEVTVPSTPNPGLSIVKSATPSDIERFLVGQEITYTFVVTNTGNVTLTDVTPVEGDFTGSGELGPITPDAVTLAPTEQATFTSTYVLTQADIDSGSVRNTATATGVPPTGPPVDSPPAEVEIPTPAMPDLTIVKTADVQKITHVGQLVTYSFVVENVGNVTMTDVHPVEVAFSGTGRLGAITPESVNLAPGEKAVFTATYSVTAADLEHGTLENTATVEGVPPGGGIVEGPPSTAKVPAAPLPGLPTTGSSGIAGLALMGLATLAAGGYLLMRRRKLHLQ